MATLLAMARVICGACRSEMTSDNGADWYCSNEKCGHTVVRRRSR